MQRPIRYGNPERTLGRQAVPAAFLRARVAGLVAVVLVVAVACPGLCMDELSRVPDEQLSFADALMKDGEYYRAITEYKRFLHFFPDHPRADEARLSMGEAYMRGGRHDEAIAVLNDLATRERVETGLSRRAMFLISETYEKQEEYELAGQHLDYIIITADSESVANEAMYRKGWLFVESGSYDQAVDTFSHLTESGRESYRIPTLLAALEVGRNSLDPKHPAVAGALGIIPGAGHLYTGRYRDALIAFGLNAALGFAAYEAFDQDMEVLGGVIATVGLGFYTGSIYGAVGSVEKYNRHQREGFVRHLKNQAGVRLGAGYWPSNRGLAVCLEFRF
ncbi:MAG: tetratricopeptide repeat protein [Desulfatibacillaceae bacterium]